MNSFTISQMQQYSGIKAHTLRIWEKRYNGLSPARSRGNTRYYSGDQLRRLLNIAGLITAGHKVSDLCRMPDSGLFKLVAEQSKKTIRGDNPVEFYILQLISAGMNFNEPYFDKMAANCFLRLGIARSYSEVIYPLLVRIGLLWSADSIPPAQEHFLSNLIRQKLFAAIDSLPPADPRKKNWLLFLPEDELHEIGLLFAHFRIRQAGHRSVYLGANVPFSSVEKAIHLVKPDIFLLFFVSKIDPVSADTYLGQLVAEISPARLIVALKEEMKSSLAGHKGVTFIHSVQQLEAELENQDT